MSPIRLLRTAQSALRRSALVRSRLDARPPVVVPDAVRAAQRTRSTSPSYVSLVPPVQRRPAHDDAAAAPSSR